MKVGQDHGAQAHPGEGALDTRHLVIVSYLHHRCVGGDTEREPHTCSTHRCGGAAVEDVDLADQSQGGIGRMLPVPLDGGVPGLSGYTQLIWCHWTH